MLCNGLIGRAVIPGPGRLFGGELDDHHAFRGFTLQGFLLTVGGEDLDRVAGQRRADLLQIGVQLQLILRLFAGEDDIGRHVEFSFLDGCAV